MTGQETGCPDRLWRFHLGKYSKHNWETCCSWPCLSYRVLQDGFWKSLPNPFSEWFWEMWTGCPGFVASFENCQSGFLHTRLESISWAMRFIKLATNTDFVSGNSISKAVSCPPLHKTFLYKHGGHVYDVFTPGNSCCLYSVEVPHVWQAVGSCSLPVP